MKEKLYEDLFKEIYEFVPFDDKFELEYVSKFFNNLYNQDLKKIVQIQKFYKKNRLNDYYLLDAGLEKYKNGFRPPNYDDWNVLLVYRYYMAKYESRYLLSYPEFLTNKAINDTDKKNSALNWIHDNLNNNHELRTRREIYNFFVENNITFQEISIAGW